MSAPYTETNVRVEPGSKYYVTVSAGPGFSYSSHCLTKWGARRFIRACTRRLDFMREMSAAIRVSGDEGNP